MKNKAVILGANYYIGLSIIRCLGIKGIDVVAVDYSLEGAYALKSKYVSEILIGPHYKENSEELLEFLITYSKKQALKPVLYPSADQYVEFIDKYFDTLKQYYLISQSEKGLYTKAMNKESLSELAKLYKVKIPETISTTDVDFEQKIESIIKFPCLVKPVDSPTFVAKFRKKLFKANDFEELNKCIKMAQDAGCEVIVQRIIPGFDDHMYTFDAYLNQESKVTHWVTCQKYRQYPINFGASVYTSQKYVPELFEESADLLEGIGWKGFAEIEYKKDSETGLFYMIEINVRTTNLNVLLLKSGLNMPYLAYKELSSGIEEPPKVITKDNGLVFWYSFEDLLAVKGYLRSGQLTFWQVFRSYFRKKVHSTWDIKDPKPYIAFISYKLSKYFKRKTIKN